MVQAEEVTAGLGRLAGLTYEGAASPDTLTKDILALVAESLNVAVTFLSTINNETLYLQAVHDRGGMGISAGEYIPLCDTY